MGTKINKLRERLAKHRLKISELEAQAAEMEQEIKRAEEEQLGYLARSAANNLTGGMEEIFALLQGLRSKPESQKNTDESKEGETVDSIDKTVQSEETEV